MCVCVHSVMNVCVLMAEQEKSPLPMSVVSALDEDVDCFSMTAVVWALGLTVFNAPLQCLEGNTIWPHAAVPQSFEMNAGRSTIYYPSETTFRGNNTLALCASASTDTTGTDFLHSILFSHLFWLLLCLGSYGFHKRFANSVLEKGYASLLLRYYSYYFTATSRVLKRAVWWTAFDLDA